MMKRVLFLSMMFIPFITSFAQTWTSGTSKLYVSPSNTNVGIGTINPSDRLHVNNGALRIGEGYAIEDRILNLLNFGDEDYVQIGEWEADDQMSFKANNFNFVNGNVGIGISNPQYKLDVNGKMYLHTTKWENSCAYSYLNWECHRLVMGVPVGQAAVSILDLMSGGSNAYDSLYSEFNMYTAYGENNTVAKIRLNTIDNSWINTPSNFGIGTDQPQCKLDVRGAVRANAIYVNQVSGADFVFDESYKLRPLSEVKDYVQRNQHLPEIPSAAEMQENGVNMNELQMQLLQKVEELTLYIIQQEQRIQELESQLAK